MLQLKFLFYFCSQFTTDYSFFAVIQSLVRPQDATRGMRRSRRKWMNLSTSIRRCFRMNSSGEADDDLRQYTIPPRKEKRWLSIQDVFFPKQRPLVACVLWLYQTTLFNALLSMFLGYFVCIWIFALLVYAIDPGCLSGWDDVPGSFIHSFYIPFQVKYSQRKVTAYRFARYLPHILPGFVDNFFHCWIW